MESALAIPYADTRPEMLSLSLDSPALPALAELALEVDGAVLTMKLLGASHQVEVALPAPTGFSTDRSTLRETVACSPDRSAPLPSALDRSNYRFTSVTSGPDDDALITAVDQLRRTLADDPFALIGHYPGDVNAVTAIRARATGDGVEWDTWHTYPQSGHIVRTTSRCRWECE